MTISGNYPSPVQVNGFLCRNCTDVDYAKKHIDPAHPRSGPYNIDAKDDPSRTFSNATNASGNSGGPPATGNPGYSPTGQSVSGTSQSGQQLDTSA
jgi:hypothetical protein